MSFTPAWGDPPAGSPDPDWWTAFIPGASCGPGVVRVQALGELVLPSGSLVVSDTDERPVPLPVELAPGAYPAWLSVLELPGGDERVAGAALRLSGETPVRWERSYPFTVDSGSACLSDQVCWRRFQRDWEESYELLAQAWQQPGRGSWDWASLPLELAAPPGLPAPNLLWFSSGRGDGVYATWLGYAPDGALCAVVAGCGLLPGDTAEGCPQPDRPDRRWLAALRGEFMRRYNLGLRGGNFTALGELCSPEVALVRATGELRGVAQVLAGLRDEPLAGGRISANSVPGGVDLERGALTLRLTPEGKPRKELGTLRLETKRSRITRILFEADEPDASSAERPALPQSATASEADEALVRALQSLEGLSPIKRAFVDEVARQVLGLKRPLSAAQREKARGLVGSM